MASQFIKTGGNLSTVAYQKVAFGQASPNTPSYYGYTVCNPVQYQAFTPTVAGTCEGVFLGFKTDNILNTHTVTATLQFYSGGTWADVAGATATVSNRDIAGTNYTRKAKTSMGWIYMTFATPAAITTDVGVWRIKVLSTNASTYWMVDIAGGFSCAIVLSDAGTFTSGDDVYINAGQTITVDTSLTVGKLVLGTTDKIQWVTPAAAYTLTATQVAWSMEASLYAGTSLVPIPLAQKATFNITTTNLSPNNYMGNVDREVSVYGAKPTNYISYLNTNAAATQKVIVTTTDMSAYWSPGDTIWVYGGNAADGTYRQIEPKIIDTIVGTTITFTVNLGSPHLAGWAVVDFTRFTTTCGFAFGAAGLNLSSQSFSGLVKFNLSGVYCPGALFIGFVNDYLQTDFTNASPYYISDVLVGSLSIVIIYIATGNVASSTVSAPYYNGSIIENLITNGLSTSNYTTGIVINSASTTTLTNIFGCGLNSPSITVINSTITNLQVLGTYANYAGYNGPTVNSINSTFTNCKFLHGYYAVYVTGVTTTFTNCTFDYGVASSVFMYNTFTGNKFISCSFGVAVAAPTTFTFSTFYQNVETQNCLFGDTAQSGSMTLASGVYVKDHAYNNTAADHRTYWPYGYTVSTGTGLADTTVHTSGAGKYAIRLQSISSTNVFNNWSFNVPTGDIAAKTMNLSIWVNINNAAYYAGTNQLPRITVNYDNGTIAYSQASNTTGWQLLNLPFTPATSYGQVTVTLSTMTDATGSNAYVYFDDMSVSYPPNTALDLGGLDLWANALPVTPPIALPLSAGTVANQVWEELQASHTTSGSEGAKLKSLQNPSKVLPSGIIV